MALFKTVLSGVKIRDGHDNFFTPLRLIFALLVLVGHSFIIFKQDAMGEPHILHHYTFSYLAVNLFFIASGFLVTKSMLYRKEVSEFAAARILRIYPALFIHVLFVMFIVYPFVGSIPFLSAIKDPQFFTQPLQVLSFYQSNMMLPGAFEGQAETIASGALWTLRYEILAYIGTLVAFKMGLLNARWLIAAQFLAFAWLWPFAHMTGLYDAIPATGQSILRFGLCYSLGAAIFAYRDKLSFNAIGVLTLLGITFLTKDTVLIEVSMAVCLAYFVFWAAYLKLPARFDKYQSMTDISYGVYIYHWCILQWVYYLDNDISLGHLIGISCVISMILGLASWHFVEKTALGAKTQFAKYLRRGKPSKARIYFVLSTASSKS